MDFIKKHLTPKTLYLKPFENRGFTLLEILIAIFILTVVVSTIFTAFSGTFKVVNDTESQGEIYAMARVALERISEDLASVYVGPLSNGQNTEEGASQQRFLFVGEDLKVNEQSADTLRFLSYAHVSFKTGRQDVGPAEITYYSRFNEDTGEQALYRSDTLDYLEGTEMGNGGFLLCDRLKWVDFTYYDGENNAHKTWSTTENNGKKAALPSRVEISMGFENVLDPENPMQFITGVALPSVE